MSNQPTQDELWKLYEGLPEELKSAIFSAETAEQIRSICERNEIDEVQKVAKLTGNVLLGILFPENFQSELEKELEIGSEPAKNVTQEINRFIFYPVRPVLEKLHEIKVAPERKSEIKQTISENPEEETKTEKTPEPKKQSIPSSQDTYRENIE